MRTRLAVSLLALPIGVGLGVYALAAAPADTYKVTGTAIEACSCPLFCPCYYNEEPAGGHHCQFNIVYKMAPGSHWGNVDLSDAKIWLSGDLGGHFGDGTTEWAVVTFDRATTPEQREALNGWIGKMFPVQWGKVEVREDSIAWHDGKDQAHAKMESGMAEVTLNKVLDAEGKQATVTHTGYWAADSNEGFLLAHSTHYFKGEPSYDYQNRNGFVITATVEGQLDQ